jgi:hypothetical protein
MELFGIVLSVPVAFVASLVYRFILARGIVRFPTASRWLWWMSAGILAWFCIEVALLVTMGAVGSRRFLGPVWHRRRNGPFSQSELGFPSRLRADIRLLFR